MQIIILGAGNVGYTLAETLSAEKHSITVIDTNEEALAHLSALDVSSIRGNGASYRVLSEAGIKDCDLLIAVTSRDEVNMLCCLLAKKVSHARTIARVRDPDYYRDIDFVRDELGLALSINPELSAASYIYQLIRCPSAMELSTFAKGRIQMVSMTLPAKSPWVGKTLIEISRDISMPMLIAILERDGNAMIPTGQTQLCAGDRISVIVSADSTANIFSRIGVHSRPIKNVMIVGGGAISFYLARRLIQSRINVTIIEQKRERCETLSELLPKATIIHGNASNEQLLQEEGLSDTDAFVSLTEYDEENIMLALYANRMSSAKLITKVNKTNFNRVISEIPVGSVISPKHLTSEIILRYARAQRESPDSDVDAVYRMADDQVEALAFRIKEHSSLTNCRLMDLQLRKGVLIGAIIRDNNVIIPSGQDCMLPGDFVIVITTVLGMDSIKGILE